MRTFDLKLTGEKALLTAYLPDDSKELPMLKKRPCVLVIPGGGYSMCSDREAEPVALAFLSKGYAAFALRYSTGRKYDFSAPMADADEAMKTITDSAREWGVDASRIAAIGFSAGGHLCAALSVAGKIRPAASVLIYPCILNSTSRILAFPVPSLEKKTDGKTPPAFIVASSEDSCVPVKNSLAYAAALEEAKIPFEIHIYEKGEHGFSLATPELFNSKRSAEYNSYARGWFELCAAWLKNRFRFPY